MGWTETKVPYISPSFFILVQTLWSLHVMLCIDNDEKMSSTIPRDEWEYWRQITVKFGATLQRCKSLLAVYKSKQWQLKLCVLRMYVCVCMHTVAVESF